MSQVKSAAGHLAFVELFNSNVVLMDRTSAKKTQSFGVVGHPDGIQVDSESGYIYWTDMGALFDEAAPQPDGGVYRSKFDGSERMQIVGSGQMFTGKQLYLDRAQKRLYWCDREGGRVMSCDLNGQNLTTLVERGHGEAYPRSGTDQPVGVARDEKRKHIYWTQKGFKKGNVGRIFRAGDTIPEGEFAYNRTDIVMMLGDLPEPIDLEIDSENDILYWTDRGAGSRGNSLNRAKISDAGLSDYEVIATGFSEAIGLARVGQMIYVSDLSGKLYEIDLATLEKRVLLDNQYSIAGMAAFA